MKRITASSLREEARRAIRAGIITGEIEAGAIHSAPSLAQELGVSPTPVREALLDLANEGLVEAIRNRGFRVIVLDERDLDEIFELRILLEVPSVAKVAGTLSPRQIELLRQDVDRIEETASNGNLGGYLTADHAFHLRLLEPLNNRRLVELVGLLRNQQRLSGLPGLIHSNTFMATAREHRAILEGVETGDSQGAEALMRQHLKHTRGVWAGVEEEAGAPTHDGVVRK